MSNHAKRSKERIEIDGYSYRRFVSPPENPHDGTVRCRCGQIDDPRWHDGEICNLIISEGATR